MVYDAKAIEIMIASPSDVVEERGIVREVISEWNAIHSQREAVCLMPVGWDTHSSPELAGRPQQIINERVLEDADLLVGIFWTRVGSPTGESISGSIEEIEQHMHAGKPVMLYFSNVPVRASHIDRAQYDALEEFKAWAQTQGLIQNYESAQDFRDKFRGQLQITLNENGYLKEIREAAPVDLVEIFNNGILKDPTLSEDAREMLLAASEGSDPHILVLRHSSGTSISAGARSMVEDRDKRGVARWTAAAEELYHGGYTRDINGKGEIFELNHAGYTLAEKLKTGDKN